MTSRLAQLRKNRPDSIKQLQEKLEAAAGGSSFKKDDRIWKPTFNKDKPDQQAIVRFLPANGSDNIVHMMNYDFDGPGGRFWGFARQTVGLDDPVQKASMAGFIKAKATGNAALKSECLKYLPKSTYYANVLVIKDRENPENNGKVMIFQFGPMIYKLIEKAIKPKIEDEQPLDIFDPEIGANFKINIEGSQIPDRKDPTKKVDVPKYESSKFDSVSVLFDGDEDEIERVLEQAYDLSEFISVDKFKSFEEDAERFKKVTGKPYNWLEQDGLEDHIKETQTKAEMENNKEDRPPIKGDDDEEDDDDLPFDPDEEKEDSGEEDDVLARFRKLAKSE